MHTYNMQVLAEGLEENVTLQALLMSTNCIGDRGGWALVSALELNQSLTQISVADNGMGEETQSALVEACNAHEPTDVYGRKSAEGPTLYTNASRQLYQEKFGLRTEPVRLLL